jgi:hypothetical protein
MMPLPTVACQARRFNTKYSPYFAATYFRGQAFEAGTVDPTRAGSPQIVINDEDALETQRAGSIRETELEARAFLVVNQLAWLGLANINNCFPRNTFRRELGIHPVLLLRFQAARCLLPLR